jgi:hypothetical protein
MTTAGWPPESVDGIRWRVPTVFRGFKLLRKRVLLAF